MVTLYDKAECPFCWRVRMALSVAGLAFEAHDHTKPPWSERWASLTDTGTVPVMEWDAEVWTDSADMLETLHTRSGPLWPVSADAARAHTRAWDSRLGKAIRQVVFEKRDKAENEWDLEVIQRGEADWLEALPDLETALSGQVCFSAGFGTDVWLLPDLVLATRFGMAAAYQLPLPESFPSLHAWFRTLASQEWFTLTAPPRVLNRLEHNPWMATPSID
ncbi:MAG: glutathione S-transferase family protein [Gammaproteobacteria bacterium]